MNTEKNLTGKPSVERPWMKFYPDVLMNMISIPGCTIEEYLHQHCPGMDVIALHYYGEDVAWKQLFEEVDRTARSLKALGFGEGDQIPVYLRLVPEFISLLLGAERIGASVVARDNTLDENVEAARKANAKYIFAQDFLSQEELETYQRDSSVEKAILISPVHRGSRDAMPDYIQNHLDSFYPDCCASGEGTMTWEEFLALGDDYYGEVEAPVDIDRPLFRVYTSGSTGPSKQVIHSAGTILGILCQMNFYGGMGDIRPTWMVSCLPSALLAPVLAWVLLPLSSNKLMIMTPFCDVNDVDLEMMRYKPNNWPLIVEFLEVLVRSKRISKDYDMSHLVALGPGCESMNNRQWRRAQQFVESHNCKFRVTPGYGSTEIGSALCMPMAPGDFFNGNTGVPLPLSTVGIFKPGTQEELGYNQIGEICKCGPGNMLGYDDPEMTAKTLQIHPDGKAWLHMGDEGYIDENGMVYCLNRGTTPRYGGGNLATLIMENKVADAEIPGIDDEFFVVAPDDEHPGCFLPYLFVVLDEGYTIEDVREDVMTSLKPYMRPVEIFQLEERPFYHYKTNRLGMAREIQAAKVMV